MLQQTQVATVLERYERWFNRFPTVNALAEAPESAVLHEWQGLGYYQRARNLHRCARTIVDHFDGVFPATVRELSSLPGVGRYTVGAIMSFAFDRPAPIVDANVARVLSRLIDLEEPIDRGSGKKVLWDAAARHAAGPQPGLLNSALMELGALICVPRKPRCVICPVREFCRARDPESLPKKSPRPAIERRIERYLFIQRSNQILVQQNVGKRWRGLWSLPQRLGTGASDNLAEPIVALRHPITRFVVQLEVFRGSPPSILEEGQRWCSINELDQLPMPSPHRRALEQALDLARGAERSAYPWDENDGCWSRAQSLPLSRL